MESTFIEIIAKNGKTIVVGSLYKLPNSESKFFMDTLMETIARVQNERKELILVMDHNIDLIKSSEHRPTQKSLDSLIDRDVFPTITRPTHVTHTTVTLIDNI